MGKEHNQWLVKHGLAGDPFGGKNNATFAALAVPHGKKPTVAQVALAEKRLSHLLDDGRRVDNVVGDIIGQAQVASGALKATARDRLSAVDGNNKEWAYMFHRRAVEKRRDELALLDRDY